MELSAFNLSLLLIGLALTPGCLGVSITKGLNGNGYGPEKHVFSEFDWELEPNQIVPIYSRNFDHNHRFAFVAHVPSETKAEVVMATLFSTDDDQKVCEEDFSNPYGGEPIFTELNILDRHKLQVYYTAEEVPSFGAGWISDVDTSNCVTPDVAKAAAPTAAQPETQENWNSTHRATNISHSARDILEPAEVNSTAGFVFTRESNETDASTSIMFTNSATGETQVLGVIQEAAGNGVKRESRANGKYGMCMLDDIDVLCVQRSYAGRTIMNYTHLELPKKPDWFTVHNLKASAMLVATGDCPNNRCSEFKVRKLEQGDKVSKEVSVLGFRMNCASSELQMFATDVASISRLCFNFVCTGKDYYSRRVFQYRRHCFKRDYFEKN